MSCLPLWAGNSTFLLRIDIWSIFFWRCKNPPVPSDIKPPLHTFLVEVKKNCYWTANILSSQMKKVTVKLKQNIVGSIKFFTQRQQLNVISVKTLLNQTKISKITWREVIIQQNLLSVRNVWKDFCQKRL